MSLILLLRYLSTGFLVAATAILSACGGGGGSDGTGVASTAEGLWIGVTSTNRTLYLIVLDNGTFWSIYSAPFNSNVIAGGMQGNAASANGSFSSTNVRNFNLEGLGILDATVSGTYVTKQSLNGTVTQPTLAQIATFTTAYDTDYGLAPSLASLAGTYTGSAAVVAGPEPATVTISPTGAITGSSMSGCQFTGSTAPHSKGNVYEVSVTFGGGVCSNGTDTVTGIGFFDAPMKQLFSTTLNSTRTNGFIFVGTKP